MRLALLYVTLCLSLAAPALGRPKAEAKSEQQFRRDAFRFSDLAQTSPELKLQTTPAGKWVVNGSPSDPGDQLRVRMKGSGRPYQWLWYKDQTRVANHLPCLLWFYHYS